VFFHVLFSFFKIFNGIVIKLQHHRVTKLKKQNTEKNCKEKDNIAFALRTPFNDTFVLTSYFQKKDTPRDDHMNRGERRRETVL